MSNTPRSLSEAEKFEQWLDDQLTGKYATGDIETELRMAVATIRGMPNIPKDHAVQPLKKYINRQICEALGKLRSKYTDNVIGAAVKADIDDEMEKYQ